MHLGRIFISAFSGLRYGGIFVLTFGGLNGEEF